MKQRSAAVIGRSSGVAARPCVHNPGAGAVLVRPRSSEDSGPFAVQTPAPRYGGTPGSGHTGSSSPGRPRAGSSCSSCGRRRRTRASPSSRRPVGSLPGYRLPPNTVVQRCHHAPRQLIDDGLGTRRVSGLDEEHASVSAFDHRLFPSSLFQTAAHLSSSREISGRTTPESPR